MFYDLNCLLLKSFWLRRTWNQRKKTKPDFSQLYRTNCWWSIRGFVFASVRVIFSVCCYCFFFFLLHHKWRHKFLIYNYKIWYLYLLIALGFLTEFEMKRKIKTKKKRNASSLLLLLIVIYLIDLSKWINIYQTHRHADEFCNRFAF